MASFFTPASQKPKDKTSWSERSPADGVPGTLLVARYDADTKEDPGVKRTRVAAFDLDSTLIATASGKKHSSDESDWRWWSAGVPDKLRSLHAEGYRVIILSNQGGLTLHVDPKSKAPKASGEKRLVAFKRKCSAVLAQLDLPITLYAATGKDRFRKPRTGMWEEACKDYGLDHNNVDLTGSVFVGDAGGRTAVQQSGSIVAKDFSCSDRNLAHNIGINFQTPEEYFLQHSPRTFSRELDLAHYGYAEDQKVAFDKKHKQEMVVFCGPPGAGKSTFYAKMLQPLGYERINQDTLKTRDKCLQVAKEKLSEGASVAIGMCQERENEDKTKQSLKTDTENRQYESGPRRTQALDRPGS